MGFLPYQESRIPPDLWKQIFQSADDFFALPEEKKLALHVKDGGVAWRGFMPRGGEATHGFMDHKEGLYFGTEHQENHHHAVLPLHGKDQFPDDTVPTMRSSILTYIDQVTKLGKCLSDAISLSLGSDVGYMRQHFLSPEPVASVRYFKYFAPEDNPEGKWGIGEHTDFGYLTILNQGSPGLQILSPTKEWVDVPADEDTLVCNVGDMIDMMTGGRFKSVPHRVRPPPPGSYRISFPFFFDFSWDAKMVHLPLGHLMPLSQQQEEEAKARWANSTFTGFNDPISWCLAHYLAKKVKKVFLDLDMPDFEHNSKLSTRFTVEVNV
ncbi:Clavaminate synthase-like protein [Serendipita vermifera]|nr:Clavaminate synthase-like protein [Serendipita vermifera]